MKIRLATYNLNNLLERCTALESPGVSPRTRSVLAELERLEALLGAESYGGRTGRSLVALLKRHYGCADSPIEIETYTGRLVARSRGQVTLHAQGRGDWSGRTRLRRTQVDPASIATTARVIAAAQTDVLCVQECESRSALRLFNDQFLRPLGAAFPHLMVVEGNDTRGLHMGLFSRYPIRSTRSHVDDTHLLRDGRTEHTFSRDCLECEITLPGTQRLWVLVNHFKGASSGKPADADLLRLKQATAVRSLVAHGHDLSRELLVVAGDLGQTPDHASLTPLLPHPELTDALTVALHADARGTFVGTDRQLDYLLLSQPLSSRLRQAGVERRGWYQRKTRDAFAGTPEAHASDHALAWADVEV